MEIPGIIIAGTNSGSGKTTISTGLMAALIKRGHDIQPFKTGPDYIDTMFHSHITKKKSRNLDSWLLEPEILEFLFQSTAKKSEISVIEGVMGLYDGFSGKEEAGSTAHLSKIIKAPVILIVNGEGMSGSIAALINGFSDFDDDVDIQGVIINNINSESHYQLLKDIILSSTKVKPLGYMPRLDYAILESRHLGLIPAGEVKELDKKIEHLADKIEKTVDIDGILNIAFKKPNMKEAHIPDSLTKKSSVRIGIAKDKAFNFYYQDNLELLEMLGANLIYFSPMEDRKLPDNLDGIYFGGGYPEVFCKELSCNQDFKDDLMRYIERHIPVYAECGGLMYLSNSINLTNGEKHEMVGAISGDIYMTDRLKRFGYSEVEVIKDNPISKKGDKIRVHEFHFSEIRNSNAENHCFKIKKKRFDNKVTEWTCGYSYKNIIAGYPHIHFWSNISFARTFIDSCNKYRLKRAE
jgi:cobyrinic acid a,c-diamide synthase